MTRSSTPPARRHGLRAFAALAWAVAAGWAPVAALLGIPLPGAEGVALPGVVAAPR